MKTSLVAMEARTSRDMNSGESLHRASHTGLVLTQVTADASRIHENSAAFPDAFTTQVRIVSFAQARD